MKRTTALFFAVCLLLSFPVTAASVTSVKIPKGAVGVWTVNSIHTESPLYKSKANNSKENQKVVDKDNAALWWAYSKGHAIVDHLDSEVGDGLWRLNGIILGDIATLTTKSEKRYYECIGIYLCTQTKYVYQHRGTTISVSKGDIICVCCADEPDYNYIAYFRYITSVKAK